MCSGKVALGAKVSCTPVNDRSPVSELRMAPPQSSQDDAFDRCAAVAFGMELRLASGQATRAGRR